MPGVLDLIISDGTLKRWSLCCAPFARPGGRPHYKRTWRRFVSVPYVRSSYQLTEVWVGRYLPTSSSLITVKLMMISLCDFHLKTRFLVRRLTLHARFVFVLAFPIVTSEQQVLEKCSLVLNTFIA